jgi:hypothetical protein
MAWAPGAMRVSLKWRLKFVRTFNTINFLTLAKEAFGFRNIP